MKNLKMFIAILISLIVPRNLHAATVSQYLTNPSYQYNNYGNYQIICSSNQYRCSAGFCIHESLRCNGLAECPAGDDEQLCPPSPSVNGSTSAPDSPGNNCTTTLFYQCQESKKCVPWSQLCDGKIQCLFGDDENLENCKLVPGFNGTTQDTNKQDETGTSARSTSDQTTSSVTSTDLPVYQSTTVDYSNQGNESSGTSVGVNKAVQSADRTTNHFYQNRDDAGLVFVNFGPIINGDKNVNGNGNDIGNGNANGNENGNGNGNGNGNKNGNGNHNYHQKDRPTGEDPQNYYDEAKSYYTL